jgi:Fe-S-cluster-containing hydrogenase component 2
MGAIAIIDGIATINLDRCIGCGNCVSICASNASQLRKKDRELVPPKDMNDMYMKIMYKKAGKWNMIKMVVKILLRRRV